jgi:hypothetical protein
MDLLACKMHLALRSNFLCGPGHANRFGNSSAKRLKLRFLSMLSICAVLVFPITGNTGGITPEQIYQPSIKWNDLIGTWEVLPEGNPLEEAPKQGQQASELTLMTLRVDGTCRVFDKNHPNGSDGLWTFDQHEIFITFKNSPGMEFYIYGVKSDFMMTRTPIKGGKDQLWSRIK